MYEKESMPEADKLASSPVESHLRWGCRATPMKFTSYFIGQAFNWASKPENDQSSL